MDTIHSLISLTRFSRDQRLVLLRLYLENLDIGSFFLLETARTYLWMSCIYHKLLSIYTYTLLVKSDSAISMITLFLGTGTAGPDL